MPTPTGRLSVDIVWRPNPARFLVRFYDATMIILEKGFRPVPDCYVVNGSNERRPLHDFGAWRLRPLHQEFLDAMMLANVKRLQEQT